MMVCSTPSMTCEDNFCFSISAITPLICSLGAPGCMMIIIMISPFLSDVGARSSRPTFSSKSWAGKPRPYVNTLRPTLLQRLHVTLHGAQSAAHDLCDLADLFD